MKQQNKKLTCIVHPTYKAIRAPRSTTKFPDGCSTCKAIWNQKHQSGIVRRVKRPVELDTSILKKLSTAEENDNYFSATRKGAGFIRRVKKLEKLGELDVTVLASSAWPNDKLESLWKDQEQFMYLLQQERNFPSFPVDIAEKASQKLIKEIISDCQNELWEASYLLKNSKNHRKTEIKEFDRQSFIEEMVDAQKFLYEVLILMGVSLNEFYTHYMNKSEINVKRIKGNY